MHLTRTHIVAVALAYNGTDDGHGYDCANPFSKDLGRPQEAWCGDFVTDVYKRAGLLLPSMQAGCSTGFAYVPDALAAAREKGAVRRSWEAEPADLFIYHWPGGNPDGDHVEMFTGRDGSTADTIGGNSSGSNIDHFHGTGGAHRHAWADPDGVGNASIIAAINMSKFVDFGAEHKPVGNVPPNDHKYRLLMLKSPRMVGTDVGHLQEHLNNTPVAKLKVDSIFGPQTRDALLEFQEHHWPENRRKWDAILGDATRAALGMAH